VLNQENSIAIDVSFREQTSITPYLLIVFVTMSVLTLSLFSGFKSFPVPFDLAWQFSPIGFLQGIKPENADLATGSYFSGHFGYTLDYFFVFFKTCLAESPFYYFCFRKLPFSRFLAYLLLANFLTHPIVFFVIPAFFSKYVTAALVGEAFAPTIEAIFAFVVLVKTETKTTASTGALVIVLANLFSWEVGMFI
jgi:hypothetical protein